MKLFCYLRRNPRRVAPIFLCIFFIFVALFVLDILGNGLNINKMKYIDVYEQIQVITPQENSYVKYPDMIPVREQNLNLKLMFGTGILPLFEIALDDAPVFFDLLGKTIENIEEGQLYINQDSLKAIDQYAGLPDSFDKSIIVPFSEGPQVAIYVLENISENAYIVSSSQNIDETSFWVQNFQKQLARIRDENRFINTMMQILFWIIFIVLLIGVSALIYSNICSRRKELSILKIVGYSEKKIVSYVLFDFLLLIITGCLLGSITGWMSGMVILNQLIPEGIQNFWLSGGFAHFIIFPLILLIVILLTIRKAYQNQDPISVIEKSGDILN